MKITGTFHRAYDEQGGDMAIEGISLEVIEQGKVMKEYIPEWKIKGLGGGIFLLGSMFVIKKVKQRWAIN